MHLAVRVGRHLALSVGRHLALSVGRGKGGDKAQGWSSLLAARMGLPTRQSGTTNTCMNKICIHTHKQTGIYKNVHLALRVGRHLALSVGRGKGGDKAQGWSSLLAARMGLPTGAFSSHSKASKRMRLPTQCT